MDKIAELYNQVDALMGVVTNLRECLMWYAEPHGHHGCLAPCCIDNGVRARKALNIEVIEGVDANGSPVYEKKIRGL